MAPRRYPNGRRRPLAATPKPEPTEEKPDTRLTLHIDDSKRYIDSTIPVRWCISPEFLEELKTRKFVKPAIVILVRSFYHESWMGENEVRAREDNLYVELLDREMRYVRFVRPGNSELRAFVVDAADKNTREKLRSMKRNQSGVLDIDGKPYAGNTFEGMKYILMNVHLPVTVDPEMFAPPAPAWLKSFVHRFFSGAEVDQCHFRRRVLLSLPLTFLLLTLGQIFKLLCTVIGLFTGARSDHWPDVIHPFKGSIFGPLQEVEYSWWFMKKNKNGTPEMRLDPLLIINPMTMTLPAAASYGIMQFFFVREGHYTHAQQLSNPGFKDMLWMVDAAIPALVIAIAIIIGTVVGIGEGFEKLGIGKKLSTNAVTKALVSRLKLAIKNWEQRSTQKQQQRLQEMVCLPGKQLELATINALPPAKRTIRLRYDATKARVCKVFPK